MRTIKSSSLGFSVASVEIKVIFFDLGETLVTSPRKWLPNAKALISSLRPKGFRLGIISNTAGLSNRQAILDILPVDFDLTLFDSTLVLFSSELGKEKPHKEIFEEAIIRASVPARECLYCSESIVETLMAQYIGMRSIRVQTSPNSDLGNLEASMSTLLSLI